MSLLARAVPSRPSTRTTRTVCALGVAALLLSSCSRGPATDNTFTDALADASLLEKVTYRIPELYSTEDNAIDFWAVGCPGAGRQAMEYQLSLEMPDYPEDGPKEGEQLLILANEDNWYELKNIPSDEVDLCYTDVLAGVYHPVTQAMDFQHLDGRWRMSLEPDSFFVDELNTRARYGANVENENPDAMSDEEAAGDAPAAEAPAAPEAPEAPATTPAAE
ncbi:hypothetical protein C1Y63_08470 [Corynebacterium sp. 13CS0277]|uniref:hypothetical protein n=1 Tax=Corynebacterium sp. 13CS0277 TaxID=2071994 RepID=UPI000D02B4D8|nr:hypothetical protein [Corynebacterium sp. 13CS0277]PRQ11020.1 hypothetical protein C1Y63_08470 [Corynebacterium sp. 13CS0277]